MTAVWGFLESRVMRLFIWRLESWAGIITEKASEARQGVGSLAEVSPERDGAENLVGCCAPRTGCADLLSGSRKREGRSDAREKLRLDLVTEGGQGAKARERHPGCRGSCAQGYRSNSSQKSQRSPPAWPHHWLLPGDDS